MDNLRAKFFKNVTILLSKHLSKAVIKQSSLKTYSTSYSNILN